jgi:hypothetical protein
MAGDADLIKYPLTNFEAVTDVGTFDFTSQEIRYSHRPRKEPVNSRIGDFDRKQKSGLTMEPACTVGTRPISALPGLNLPSCTAIPGISAV